MCFITMLLRKFLNEPECKRQLIYRRTDIVITAYLLLEKNGISKTDNKNQ